MVKLNYLPANQAYIFTYGDRALRMGPDSKLIFQTRTQAVRAAEWHGLSVKSNGTVA